MDNRLPFGWNPGDRDKCESYKQELHDNIRNLNRFGPNHENLPEHDSDQLELTDQDRRLLAKMRIGY
jgi:hypothetical protein